MPDELVPVWNAIEQFYETDVHAKAADAEIVAQYACASVSNPKHREQLAGMVRGLESHDVSAANVNEVLRLASRTRVQDALANALATRQPQEILDPLVEEWRALAAPVSDDDGSMDWAGIVAKRLDNSKRVRFAPKNLCDMLGGGLLPGHNLTIFARPEAGKTALALTFGVSMAHRGSRVLYVINEDPIGDLAVRSLSCSVGLTTDEIRANPDAAITQALKKGLANLIIREATPGSIRELEALVRQHRPDVLIVDQLRNLRISKTDNYTQGLDHNSQGIRAIGKRHGIITISTTQAGDSARNKAVLDDGDIDSSNTGIPGAADVLIGMGVTDTLRSAGQRILSVCKNKVSGQHGHITVNIAEQLSRVRS